MPALSLIERKNLGPRSVSWLHDAGIFTLADLEQHGAIGAYAAVRRAGHRPSLVFVYAVQGALLDCHWNELPPSLQAELKAAARRLGPAP